MLERSDPATLVDRLRVGDRRALARALTLAEAGHPAAGELLAVSRTMPITSSRVGITGPPGVGKSTLLAALMTAHRSAGRTVGLLAFDPSSSGGRGALLGDRARMGQHLLDPGVFIRSMSSRGALGGLSDVAADALLLLDVAGFDEVLIETVGVGQIERDVSGHAETVVLILMPGGGDSLQAMKSGVMEVADIVVVNKSDLDGASRVVDEVRQAVAFRGPTAWKIPVLQTDSLSGEGIADLIAAIEAHRRYLHDRPLDAVLDRSECMNDLVRQASAVIRADIRRLVESPAADPLIDDICRGALSLRAAAEEVVRLLGDASCRPGVCHHNRFPTEEV